jgi:hypothetical protein
MLFCFHLHEEIALLLQYKKYIGGKRNEKWSVICVARTQGSYTFWVAQVLQLFKEVNEIERRERYVFGFRKVSLVF